MLISTALHHLANPVQALTSLRFFKTGPGEYAEGDEFIGVKVPQLRALAKTFPDVSLTEVVKLLKSVTHEARLLALFLMIALYRKAKHDDQLQERIIKAYLKNLKYVNNWDLVDSSASQLLGNWLLTRERSILYRQVCSPRLWTRRVAMVATHEFIRNGESKDALKLAALLLGDQEDLIHKAAGWMVREVGQRVSMHALQLFLRKHAKNMPRTMLRYAIEKLPAPERKAWMNTTS